MATKKQKHQQAMEKRQRFLDDMKREGEEAVRKDREHRRRQELQEWQENHDKRHSWKKRIAECPHCKIELSASRRAEQEEVQSTSNEPSEAIVLTRTS